MKNVRVLREATPVAVPGLPVLLFPCPLRNRNSVNDPTAWIGNHPPDDGARTIRIGLAHGSLNFLAQLPLDDHLIRADAAEHFQLDYLALGHWHKELRHPRGGAVVRTAYSGTHEPMRFPGSGTGLSTGWRSYSADGDAERFQDAGTGTALLVSIEERGAPPQIETVEVGRLRWLVETRDVTTHLGDIVSEFAEKEGRERTLLRLCLTGVLDPEKHQRLDSVLKEIVTNRYCQGSSLHTTEVLIEPNPEELRRIVGDGVLARILEAPARGSAGVGYRRQKRRGPRPQAPLPCRLGGAIPMILEGFTIENWSCIKHLTVSDLPQTGVVVLHGPNGTGKSSILEALRLASWTTNRLPRPSAAGFPRIRARSRA